MSNKPEILGSPFGTQMDPSHRDPVHHLCEDADYCRCYKGILTRDRLAGADLSCLDSFPLRAELIDSHGVGESGVRAIVDQQLRLSAEVDEALGIPPTTMTAALHSKVTGGCYAGSADPHEVDFLTRSQLEIFGPDTNLLFETTSSSGEAMAIAKALKSLGRSEGVRLAFTLNERFTLPSGEDPLEVLVRIHKEFPELKLGLNCFPPDFGRLKRLLKALAQKGVHLDIVYPNSLGFGGTVEKEGVDGFKTQSVASFCADLWRATSPFRVKVVGLCCGGDSNHVQALSDLKCGASSRLALAA